eukprot:TRINITY_DN8353_c0_g4_i1.p1 TRINITY_DN8353_c0_g4~~TRINITY_DN8353_c0_g4_i1.p1  ORF type:complete len:621 (-),score=38.53 TRINITY_DN8353_c0_g4_i1:431-2251(-)
MACLACGSSRDLVRSTCSHQFCQKCLRSHINSQLTSCRDRWQLRILCPEETCAKVLCHDFVLECSQEAAAVWRGFEPRGKSLSLQLAIARLKRTGGPHLIWGPRVAEEGPVCGICNTSRLALRANPVCGHAACDECWSGITEQQILSGCTAPSCCWPSCCSAIDLAIFRFLSLESPVVESFVQQVDAEMRRLKRTAGNAAIFAVEQGERWLACQLCGNGCRSLLKNRGCSHSACESCWSQWGEAQVPDCVRAKRLRPKCYNIDCQHPIDDGIWRQMVESSQAVQTFAKTIEGETSRLKNQAGAQLVRESLSCDDGPVCSLCQKTHLFLLSNPDCNHTACEDCWSAWAEREVEHCASERKLWACCLWKDCTMCMARGIWEHSRTLSKVVSRFADNSDAEVSRLTRTAEEVLEWAPSPSLPGPECFVCRERHLALLTNPSCGHSACEHCWTKWAELQLPMCRGERRALVRCLGEGCRENAASPIWSHSCTLSEAVQSLNNIIVFRRRIEENPLFPPAVQVECPRAECLGLGYLGFDTVMCFLCEHQWQDVSGEPAATEFGPELELLPGEVMKKCPACGVHIVKNGGCDHMTCKCTHQFWWSTLLPYGH